VRGQGTRSLDPSGIEGDLPDSWRTWLARAAPRLPGAKPPRNRDSAYDVAHFERFYATVDPWGLARSANDHAKYVLTLELCGSGPFGHALEIGCSEGLFTELLAPRCRSLLAVDISTRAIRRARARLADRPNVTFQVATLPAHYPDGVFDLIVASDVLYYWRTDDLGKAARRIADSLAPSGRFIAIHFALPVVGGSTGDVVHDVLRSCVPLTHVRSDRSEIGSERPYRIDIWERPT
jgi:SAM-dependent methyltransferase